MTSEIIFDFTKSRGWSVCECNDRMLFIFISNQIIKNFNFENIFNDLDGGDGDGDGRRIRKEEDKLELYG